jgi:very-short-patch-repair endonuclease
VKTNETLGAREPLSIERALARLAGRQHGVATSRQLAALGLGRAAVGRRVDAGRFRRLHRGVYLVAPVTSRFTAEMAALLACGPRSALSHRTAAAMWGIRPHVGACVEVILRGREVRSRDGVRVHATRVLDADDVALHDGLRVTGVARTLLDLAATSPSADLARAVDDALIRRLVTPAALRSVVGRHPEHRGTSALLAAHDDEPQITRSEAERLFLALVRRAGLPTPLTNVRVAGHEVDFHWPDHDLVVEVDGYAFHSTRRAFERDRRRDADLRRAGCAVQRVSYAQITREPLLLVADLAAALLSRPRRASGPSARRSPPSPVAR